MKKSSLHLLCGVSLAALLLGCSWQVPQKIAVKTDATYNYTIASIEKDLNEFISPKVLQETIDKAASGKGIQVYDYNPGKTSDSQQYLMKVPVHKIPLDLSTYMSDLTQDSVKVNQTLKLDEVKMTGTKDINTKTISDGLSNLVVVIGPAQPEANIKTTGDVGQSFDSIQYASGEMKVYLDGSYLGTNPKVSLVHNGSTLASKDFTACTPVIKTYTAANGSAATFTGNFVATLDISNKNIYMSGMKFVFTDYGDSTFFYGEVDNTTSTVKKATGLNLKDYEINLSDTTFSGLFPASVKACTISEGSLSTSLVLPTSWTNATADLSIEITGAMNIPKQSANINLSGTNIQPGDFIIKPSAKINVTNGDIYLDLVNPNLNYNIEVKKLSSVTVDSTAMTQPDGSNFDTAISKNVSLPTNVTDYITEIWFDESDFDIKYSNTLPQGNDISVDVASAFLNLSDTVQMTSNSKDQAAKLKSTADNTSGSGKSTTSANIDFTGTINLPNKSGTDFTLKDIVLGTDYNVGIEILPNIKWAKANVDMSKVSSPIKGTMDTGVNFKSVLSSVSSGTSSFMDFIEFASVPVYIYCQKPASISAFNNIAMNGKVWLTSGTNKTYIVGSETTTDVFRFNGLPELALTDGVVTENLGTPLADVKDAFSPKSAGTITMDYDISVSGTSGTVTLTPSDVGAKGDLDIVALVAIPLGFEVKAASGQTADLNILETLGLKGDLFSRSEPWNTSDFENYFKAIKSVELIFNSENLPFTYENPSNIVKCAVNLKASPNSKPKVFGFTNGSCKLTGSEIEEMLKAYPLEPEVKMVFPDGKFFIKREMKVKTKIDLSLVTDGEIVLSK